MTGKAFDRTQSRTVLTDHDRCLIREDPLIGTGLHEFADPQPAGVARSPFRRQRMVGTDYFIAVGYVCSGPQKERAIVGQVLQKIIRISGHYLHVFKREAIGFGDHFVDRFTHNHLAVIGPGFSGDIGGGEGLELTHDIIHSVFGKTFRIGQQNRRRRRPVFGLPQQIDRTQLCID